MKLSKAQQEVVDKMREGAIIYQNSFSGRVWMRKDSLNYGINSNTYMALRRNGVIRSIGWVDMHNEYFGLTEQYKNEQK